MLKPFTVWFLHVTSQRFPARVDFLQCIFWTNTDGNLYDGTPNRLLHCENDLGLACVAECDTQLLSKSNMISV